jgi:hypothetical protein
MEKISITRTALLAVSILSAVVYSEQPVAVTPLVETIVASGVTPTKVDRSIGNLLDRGLVTLDKETGILAATQAGIEAERAYRLAVTAIGNSAG